MKKNPAKPPQQRPPRREAKAPNEGSIQVTVTDSTGKQVAHTVAPTDAGRSTQDMPPYLLTLSLPRPAIENILGQLMSDLSERAYSAQWITGTERVVPLVVSNALKEEGSHGWGMAALTKEEAHILQTLADALGYWVRPNEEDTGYIPYLEKGE